MKKILSMLFAVALFCCAAIPAYAATITLSNPVDENLPYNAYKIFDAIKVEGEDDAYRYTINEDSEWFSVLANKAEDGTITSTVQGMTIHPASAEGSTVHVITFEGNAEAYALAMVEKINANVEGKTPDATLTKAEGSNVAAATVTEPGYYFVKTSSGTLCNLFTVADDVKILDKNEFKFDKYLNYSEADLHRDFAIGDEVLFRIDGLVPVTESYEHYTYIVTDTMPDELKLKTDSVKVLLNDTELTTNFTLNATEAGFTLDADMIGINALSKENATKTFSVTYTAVVKDNAKFGIYENDAKLVHGPYASDDSRLKEKHDKEKIFNHQVVISKLDGADHGKKLANAEFVLCKEDGGKVYFYKLTEGDTPKVDWVEGAGIANAQAAVDNDAVDALIAAGSITKVTTDANGAADFSGLRCGTYYLVETKAPSKYNPLLTPVKVTFAATGETTDVYQATSEIENIAGSILPSTGGMGTTLFYLCGGALVIGAITVIIAKRRVKD